MVEYKQVTRCIIKFQDDLFEVEDIIKDRQVYMGYMPKVHKNMFGCLKWDDMIIGFIDPISKYSTTQVLNRLIREKKRKWFSKEPIFTFNILSLSPCGDIIEDWLIKVKDIKSIDFGHFNHTENGFSKLEMIITPMDCILKDERK